MLFLVPCRSKHDSILSTSKTILEDNPTLNCRINGLEKLSPKRFIIDKNLSIPITNKIIRTANKIRTYIFYNIANTKKLKKLELLSVKTIKIEIKNDHLNFDEIIKYLRSVGVYRLFIEAGIKFNNFLLD